MTIVHLSDLHCPADNAEQTASLVDAVRAARPDLVVVTGDLTRAGRKREFAAARELLVAMKAQLLVVPGNHDVPIFNAVHRVQKPFARFRATFPHEEMIVQAPGVFGVGLNTATSMQPSFDWSLGWAMPHRIARSVVALKSAPADTVRLVACHHPLLPEDTDLQRSRTRNGPTAFHELARAGMDVLLHGHLHRQKSRVIASEGRQVTIIGAGTALGDRERGEPSGFNLITLQGRSALVTAMRWNGKTFVRDAQANAA